MPMSDAKTDTQSMKKIVSLCKHRGFRSSHATMKATIVVLLFLPGIVCGQSATEKQILEQLQILNQRVEKVEKELENRPSLPSSYTDPEKKVFGMRFSRGPKGHRVISVIQGSPADKAGVRPGDLVTSVDGKPVTTLSGAEILHELERNDSYVFNFESKGGESRELKITKARQGDFTNERGGFVLAGRETSLAEVDVGQAAPEIVAENGSGVAIKLSSLKGRVVLVNFTATWCGPCSQELPKLMKVYNTYHGKGLEILSVFLDQDRLAVEHYIKDHKVPWPYSFDGKGWENTTAREWGVSGVPTDPVVDKSGLVVEDNVRGDRIETAVEKYLK
jgi:thiol-disulfide isomerase/thioredoxin